MNYKAVYEVLYGNPIKAKSKVEQLIKLHKQEGNNFRLFKTYLLAFQLGIKLNENVNDLIPILINYLNEYNDKRFFNNVSYSIAKYLFEIGKYDECIKSLSYAKPTDTSSYIFFLYCRCKTKLGLLDYDIDFTHRAISKASKEMKIMFNVYKLIHNGEQYTKIEDYLLKQFKYIIHNESIVNEFIDIMFILVEKTRDYSKFYRAIKIGKYS